MTRKDEWTEFGKNVTERVATHNLLLEVERERAVQRHMRGNEHDDTHTSAEFVALIRRYVDRVTDDEQWNWHRFREVAALAVAAMERIDRRNVS